jgi:hypothetical protein
VIIGVKHPIAMVFGNGCCDFTLWRVRVIYSQWRDLESVEAMRANPDMAAYFPRIAALAFDGFAGDVVHSRNA